MDQHPPTLLERLRRSLAFDPKMAERIGPDSMAAHCGRCGTPLIYEWKRSPHMINIPRALFTTRTGREPRYHLNIEERQDWAYTGERLVPLKGYPGVVWERPKTKKRRRDIEK